MTEQKSALSRVKDARAVIAAEAINARGIAAEMKAWIQAGDGMHVRYSRQLRTVGALETLVCAMDLAISQLGE